MKVILMGNGGHARAVADVARAMDDVELVGFVTNVPVEEGETFEGLPVIDESALSRLDFDAFVVAIGDNSLRRAVFDRCLAQNLTSTALIHPSAVIAPNVIIEPGCMILAGVVINTGCRVGPDTILNTGCIVDHDCDIGAHVHIAPGASLAGTVLVGNGAFVGIGSSVVQNITIGAEAVVGAGAAVIRDVQAGSTVVGVPASEL